MMKDKSKDKTKNQTKDKIKDKTKERHQKVGSFEGTGGNQIWVIKWPGIIHLKYCRGPLPPAALVPM